MTIQLREDPSASIETIRIGVDGRRLMTKLNDWWHRRDFEPTYFKTWPGRATVHNVWLKPASEIPEGKSTISVGNFVLHGVMAMMPEDIDGYVECCIDWFEQV